MADVINIKNRKQRRTVKKPIMPNISGCDQSCSNCKFSVDKAVHHKIIAMLAAHELKNGRPAPQHLADDDTACMLSPGGGVLMKTWGWCSHWTQET